MSRATGKKRSGRYGKVYADFLADPRTAVLMEHRNGHRAVSLWCLGLAWTAWQLTDGEIPRAVLRSLFARPVDAQLLVDVGYWETTDNGWRYLKYAEAGNFTKADVARLRLTGEISQCKRWIDQGKPCSCGHHTPTGEVIGDPIGDLLAHLLQEEQIHV